MPMRSFCWSSAPKPSMVLGISFSAISRNIPSGRPPSWFIGRPLVAPTLLTPGICLSRSIRFEKNIPCPAFALGSCTHGSETSIVTILSTRAFHEALAQVSGSRACGGKRSEAGGDRCGKEEREHKHWNTDRDAFQPRQICRRQRNQSRYAPERSQYSKAAAAERKQGCFGKELTDQPPSRRTERGANGELTLSHRRLCQQQIRHVRARHQQQKSHRAEQDQQRCTGLAGDRVL